MIPGTPKDLARAAEILTRVARHVATLVYFKNLSRRQLIPAFTITPIRSLKHQSTEVSCLKHQSTEVSCLKLKRLFVILKVTLCFDHNYYVTLCMIAWPYLATYFRVSGLCFTIHIAILCSIKRKSGQGKGYIVARGGSIGCSERGLNPIWVVDRYLWSWGGGAKATGCWIFEVSKSKV